MPYALFKYNHGEETHNAQKCVSRGSPISFCPFVWRLSVEEKLRSATHEGVIL